MRPVLISLILLVLGGLVFFWLRGEPHHDFAEVRQEIALTSERTPLPTHIVVTRVQDKKAQKANVKPAASRPAEAAAAPRSEPAAVPPMGEDDYYRVERTSRGTYYWIVRSMEWKTEESAAYQNALDTARSLLAVQLREVRPDSDLVPSRTEMEKLVRSSPAYQSKEFADLGADGKAVMLKRAEIRFELSAGDYERFFSRLRLEESAQREWFFTKGLLGVLALLGAVAGYFRFDEQTKGYYSGWLRVGAIAFLAAAGVGISFLP